VGHGHGHGHGGDGRRGIAWRDALTSSATERALWVTVGICALLTLVGVVALWPSGDRGEVFDPAELGGRPVAAVVVSVVEGPCTGTSPEDGILCRFADLSLTGGRIAGSEPFLQQSVGAGGARLDVGDRILVLATPSPDGVVTYTFYDYQRSTPMLVLLALFAVAVVLLGRWKGFGALAGLGASLVVILGFILPSLLDGRAPLAVAIVGASVIAFVTLYLAHGVNIATTVALLSTFASLALTGVLSFVFVRAARFTGFTEDSTFFLDALGVSVDPRGLVLAGIVIGTLGVLDDVTVTQVSAVWELRAARPESTVAELYRSAVRIGRDHISSTVNTLFLAYAGAALPLMLLFSEAQQSVGSVATREIVAVEIVRTLVGSIGLVASVPISTFLAASVLTGRLVRRSEA
jgi:uncharacterized membrane protein